MKLRGHGNGIAIGLAALAVVIAGSGTAVAVSSTTTISDPDQPGRIAHVDSAGRLTTAAATTTINAMNYDYPSSSDFVQPVTSLTKATLGVTELVLDNSLNLSLSNNDMTVSLVKVLPGAAGHCYDPDATWTVMRREGVRLGNSVSETFASPLLFDITGAQHGYCIGVITRFSSTAAASSYPLSVTVGAYVVNGKYTGLGLPPTTPAKALPSPARPAPRSER